jgi:hypothetical protein
VNRFSILKAAALFICGGAVMGAFRGSAPTGALSGLILFALFWAISLPIIVSDHIGQRSMRANASALDVKKREAT